MSSVSYHSIVSIHNQTAENHNQWNYSSLEDPVHHIQSRFIIAEYLFFPGHLCFWFSEITVSCKFQKILPATVFKHLHIFHLVFHAFLIIIQLIDHFLRLGIFQMYRFQALLLFWISSLSDASCSDNGLLFHNPIIENQRSSFFASLITIPPVRCDTIFESVSAPVPVLPFQAP